MLAAKLSPDGRRTQRIRCHIRGTLEFMGQKLDIRILDISRTGMALKLEGWIEAKRGATVAVRCAELRAYRGIGALVPGRQDGRRVRADQQFGCPDYRLFPQLPPRPAQPRAGLISEKGNVSPLSFYRCKHLESDLTSVAFRTSL